MIYNVWSRDYLLGIVNEPDRASALAAAQLLYGAEYRNGATRRARPIDVSPIANRGGRTR